MKNFGVFSPPPLDRRSVVFFSLLRVLTVEGNEGVSIFRMFYVIVYSIS